MSVGLIAALPAEIRSLTDTLPGLDVPFAITPQLIGIVCGTGAEHADAAVTKLLGHGVEGLVSWGTAGALTRELRAGDLLLPESVLTATGGSYATDRNWLARIRQSFQHTPVTMHSGPVTGTRSVLTGTGQKRKLHVRTGAIAADMETAVIMEHAAARNLPCIAIRSVADEVDMMIPDALLRHIDRYGRPGASGLAAEIFRTPRLIGSLYRLGIAMRKATATLHMVAQGTNASLMYYR